MALRVGARVGFPTFIVYEGLLSSSRESFSSCLILWKSSGRRSLDYLSTTWRVTTQYLTSFGTSYDSCTRASTCRAFRGDALVRRSSFVALEKPTPRLHVAHQRPSSGKRKGWARGKCQAFTYGSPRARNYGYEKREGRTHAPTVQKTFYFLLPSCEERSTGQRPKTKDGRGCEKAQEAPLPPCKLQAASAYYCA